MSSLLGGLCSKELAVMASQQLARIPDQQKLGDTKTATAIRLEAICYIAVGSMK